MVILNRRINFKNYIKATFYQCPHNARMSRYYILTLPTVKRVMSLHTLPDGVNYLRGQLEYSNSGLLHFQFLLYTSKKCRASFVKRIYPSAHIEQTRSDAAEEYVWKEETRVPGTQFELGRKPFKRTSPSDWDEVWEFAKQGKFESIPSDVRIRCYNSLQKIYSNYQTPEPIEREVYLFWGQTGTGKSHKAWEEATFNAFPKDPNTKFWDGYSGQENVVIDEFRGSISISHILRWLDKYPVIVEIKGSSVPLKAKKIWITSNLHPKDWYPGLDDETYGALLRRVKITHFINPF